MSNTKVTFAVDTPQPHLPAVWNIKDGQQAHREEIAEALEANRTRIDTILYKYGGLLIRGFNQLRTAEDFEYAILRLTPVLRDYVGGTSPRTLVQGKIMTATYVPPSWSIILHQEMAYTKNPPDRIIFFCERPAPLGGYSTVGDMRLVLEKIDPAVRQKFDRHGLQLCRTLPSRQTLHLKPGIQKPWQEVFNVESQKDVEDIVSQKGWQAEWHAGGTLKLWQDLVPAIKLHPVTNEAIWCNQAHFFAPICMMKWAEEDCRIADYNAIKASRASNPEMLDNIFFGNGEPVPDEDALHVYQVLRALERPVQLNQSDILILDNLILAHGRTAFTGERSILVALANNAT